MNLDQRINLLSEIGKDFTNVGNDHFDDSFPGYEKIYNSNPWFTEEFVKFSLMEWAEQLNKENLYLWLDKYKIPDNTDEDTVLGLIMAGNIPLVGFHDFICGFITGININIKLSSKDYLLMKWVIEKFYEKDPYLKNKVTYTEERLTDYNVVIATGSNNTNRYFEYYFSKYPNILRQNRNSVAVITGDETESELEKLADDIFLYFGLGCRNVSKIYIPKGYDFNKMGNAFQKYFYLIDHYKYANNFDYQYALIAMNCVEHINFRNLLLIERSELYSPIALVNFEYYNDIGKVKKYLSLENDKIQCIVCKDKFSDNILDLGTTQRPNISDYADNIDTIEFILKIRK